MTAAEHRKAAVKLLQAQAGRYRARDIFTDWVECAALSLANAHPADRRPEREEDYRRLIDKHGGEIEDVFAQALAHVTMALEEPHDCLGMVFHELEVASKDMGQFFTPYHVSRLMAGLTVDADSLRRHIDQHGFVTLQEPACGAGGMAIAFAEAMLAADLNPQRHLHVTAWDVDRTAAHMALVQLSLLHIPARIIVGNTLTQHVFDVLHTPAHHLGLWQYRLKRVDAAPETIVLPAQPSLFEAVA